jgi:glycosylphosphatidylinositol transamidase (GPIT) subunit GPI8
MFSDLLLGYYSKYTLNKRKINFDSNEPVFMYLTGHGGDYYFKIREK